MSEAPDQPVAAETPAPGVEAEAPAATTTPDDIETEAFDRMEAPDDDPAEAGDGDPAEVVDPDKPTPAAEDPETIEVEVAGQKYKVPKALEGELLRQADYTRKTQEVAEARRLVDAEATTLAEQRAQQVENLKAFRTEHVTIAQSETALAGIEAELAEYRKYTPAQWEKTKVDDPAAFAHHADRLDFLRTMRANTTEALEAAKTDLATKESKLTESQTASQEAALSKARGERNATLAAKIEGWDNAKGQALAKFMETEIGATPEELLRTTDPRVWLAAHRLQEALAENARLRANQKQATATETALKSQTVTPAVKPAGGGAKPTGVNDGLSTEEWLRRRNAQVAKRGR